MKQARQEPAENHRKQASANGRSHHGVGYLALFPTAVATILLTIVVRRAGPPFLSLVNYQVPVWAVIIGATVLGEALPGHFLMALGIILSGLFISQWRRRAKPA